MIKYFIIFLLFFQTLASGQCNYNGNPVEGFKIVNRSRNDIEIRVWENSVLIHSHIMKLNDQLTIWSNSDILIQFHQIGPYCSNDTSMKSEGHDLPNGWSEILVPYERFKKWNFMGIKIVEHKCKQV